MSRDDHYRRRTTSRKSCDLKRRFATRADAETSAVHRARKLGIDLFAYRCNVCRTWHVSRIGPPLSPFREDMRG